MNSFECIVIKISRRPELWFLIIRSHNAPQFDDYIVGDVNDVDGPNVEDGDDDHSNYDNDDDQSDDDDDGDDVDEQAIEQIGSV